jgi:phosphatidate cytidylyltransferase
MNRRNLMQRVLFALWAIPVGWIGINLTVPLIPPDTAERLFGIREPVVFPGQLLALLIVFLAVSEYLRMLSIRFRRNGFWLVYLWLAVQAVAQLLPDNALGLLDSFGRYDMYVLLLIVAAESVIWGRYSGRWKRTSLLFSGTVFLSYASYSLLNFYQPPFQTVFPPGSPLLVSQLGIVTVVTAVFMCDTAAYFAGNLWGKHHFSSISPHKTVEGSAAGLIVAALVTLAGWWWFADERYPVWLGLLMGLLIGVVAQAGDLLVSLMKRYYRVKDASNLIPGHGGVLDRFDSLFFSAPIVNLFLIVVVRTW